MPSRNRRCEQPRPPKGAHLGAVAGARDRHRDRRGSGGSAGDVRGGRRALGILRGGVGGVPPRRQRAGVRGAAGRRGPLGRLQAAAGLERRGAGGQIQALLEEAAVYVGFAAAGRRVFVPNIADLWAALHRGAQAGCGCVAQIVARSAVCTGGHESKAALLVEEGLKGGISWAGIGSGLLALLRYLFRKLERIAQVVKDGGKFAHRSLN